MAYRPNVRKPRNRVKLDLSEAEASLVLVALSAWRDNIMATAWDMVHTVVLRKQIADQLTPEQDNQHWARHDSKL